MADTNTANIGLLLPDLGDTFNFALHVENNFSTIDGLMGAVQCTSSTRPSNTYAGQIIYETDSKRYVQNTGTKISPTWTYMSHAAMSVTSSTRPTSGLSVGETIYETDTTRLLVYNGSSWENKAFSNLSVTSSSHPSSANSFVGEQIYETDTNNSLIWDGSGWRNIQTGPWIPYTTTWGASGNNISNGQIVSHYSKTGRTVSVRIGIYGGTTTNWGSGNYTFTLPFAANIPAGVTATGDFAHNGLITGFNAGNNTFYTFHCCIINNSPSQIVGIVGGSGTFWSSGNPSSWSGASHFVINITYESAS